MAMPRQAVEAFQVPQALLVAAAAAGAPAATLTVQRAQRLWSRQATPTMMVMAAAAALPAAHPLQQLRLPTALHLAMAAVVAVGMATARAARVQQKRAALTVMQARSLPLQRVATTPQAPPVPGLLLQLQAIDTALGSTTAAAPLRTGQLIAPTAMPVDTEQTGVASCIKHYSGGIRNVATAARRMSRPHCGPTAAPACVYLRIYLMRQKDTVLATFKFQHCLLFEIGSRVNQCVLSLFLWYQSAIGACIADFET